MIQQLHLWVCTPRTESSNLNRYLYTNVHGSIIHNNQRWKQPKCPLMAEWINKMCYIHTTEYYSVLEKNEIDT